MVQAQSNSSPDQVALATQKRTQERTPEQTPEQTPEGTPEGTTKLTPVRPLEGGLIWIDLEMTGLKPDSDRIIEIALVVTDANLEIMVESEALAIRQPKATMDAMDAWNRSTHGKSGLTDRVLASLVDEGQAEQHMLNFLAPWIARGASPMCGNTICQDRRFLARWMPDLESFFHYRNLDVSTLKELARRWRPDLAKGFQKRNAHTALADIHESIDELRYYRATFLRTEPPVSDS